ncbi:hypothetical protein [Thermoflexus sp.]|uniref:hypothetical protein n=1 Tax=Thermoflexus sp. TaxID=1969742 RepID=UPI0035E40855
MAVRYIRPTRYKFEVLGRHGFLVAEQQVIGVLMKPDRVRPQPGNRYIAQKHVTEGPVLRMIYRQEGEDLVVITIP